MRRRALLAALGSSAATTAIAGCLSSVGSESPTNATDGTGTTTDPGKRTHATTSDGSVATCDPKTPTFDVAGTGTDDAPADAEYVVRDVSTSTSYDRPEKRYLLEPDAFYSTDAVEREREDSDEEVVVREIDEIHDRAVRQAIRTAIETGEWRADELPYGLRETVDEVDFVTGVSEDDTYTHVGVALHEYAVDAPPAVEFGAAIADRYVSPGDPAALSFWVANAREREWTVSAGTVPPFGMLRASASGGGGSGDDDGEFLLWRDYETEGCYDYRDGDWIVCSIGRLTPIAPCESVVREYAILPSDTTHYPDQTVPDAPGSYAVTGETWYHRRSSGGQSATLSWEVTFELERT